MSEWSGWSGYPLDCYDYQSTCGAKKGTFHQKWQVSNQNMIHSIISRKNSIQRIIQYQFFSGLFISKNSKIDSKFLIHSFNQKTRVSATTIQTSQSVGIMARAASVTIWVFFRKCVIWGRKWARTHFLHSVTEQYLFCCLDIFFTKQSSTDTIRSDHG